MLRLVRDSNCDPRLVAALRSGDAAFADGLIASALASGDKAIAVLGQLSGALRSAAVSAESERRANLVTEHVLAVTLRSHLEWSSPGGGRVIVAGAPGEGRAAGLRLAACAVDDAGYDALFLGNPEPFVLARLVCEQRPAAVVLGAERPGTLAALHQSMAAVHVSAPDAHVIAYGAAVSGRTRVLGATVAEDLADLVRLLPQRLACVA